ncbi:MAG: crossover junction endodeoxyribonuclease RuvC [Anaerolineales bacterium]|nr:crossover junction endodeoxyribonuclease RuvC [Anaerolineales bacterium]
MVVLGIDPGTATTGYGLVRDTPSGPTLVTYGVVLTPAGAPMPERLRTIFHELSQLILLHRPDAAAVEKLFFQRNVSTAMTVGQARGVALLALAEAGVAVGEYTPKDVKLAVAGYGGADKPQVQQMVRAILNLQETPRPDDAADALAVAICHLHSMKLKALTEG